MAYDEHHRSANTIRARVAVITLSDTRDESTDHSGTRIRQLLIEAGHVIAAYRLIRDDANLLQSVLDELLEDPSVDAVVSDGGTGISRRDVTIAVIERAIDQPLPGFGELFRNLSYEQIGSGALLSRAVGGIARGKPIFALPGSTRAVELAMTKLILPELGHLLSELRR